MPPAPSVDIDELYARFCGALPGSLRPVLRSLAHRLGFVPRPDIPWSEVFQHRVTLAAPELWLPALPAMPVDIVESAVTAHLLAVIGAFLEDRLADGQVARTASLEEALCSLEQARDHALDAVVTGASARFERDLRSCRQAIATERALLAQATPVSFDLYLVLSRDKQGPGLPASVSLAAAAGFEPERQARVAKVMATTYLGLQMSDDVVDWEDDWSSGNGAWAVSLGRARLGVRTGGVRSASLAHVRSLVFDARVLAELLRYAQTCFAEAAAEAEGLGAAAFATWLRTRESVVAEQAAGEESSAGYALRAHRLSPWATEILR